MSVRLFYRGPLKSNGKPVDKHEIRLKIHPQLVKLWEQKRMEAFKGYLTKEGMGKISILYTYGDRDYACLVNDRLELYADLDILFLRPGEPGQLMTHGGDIDNRLKTLFDALRRPQNEDEAPKGYQLGQTQNPCHCVLSDDSLITRFSVTADTLLDAESDDEVVLIITVATKKRKEIIGNMGYMP